MGFFLSALGIFFPPVCILPCPICFRATHEKATLIPLVDAIHFFFFLSLALFKGLFRIVPQEEGIEVKAWGWKRQKRQNEKEVWKTSWQSRGPNRKKGTPLGGCCYFTVCPVPSQCSGGDGRLSEGNDLGVQLGRLIPRTCGSLSCKWILVFMFSGEVVVSPAFFFFFLIVEKDT